jgi:hypothetical protein
MPCGQLLIGLTAVKTLSKNRAALLGRYVGSLETDSFLPVLSTIFAITCRTSRVDAFLCELPGSSFLPHLHPTFIPKDSSSHLQEGSNKGADPFPSTKWSTCAEPARDSSRQAGMHENSTVMLRGTNLPNLNAISAIVGFAATKLPKTTKSPVISGVRTASKSFLPGMALARYVLWHR